MAPLKKQFFCIGIILEIVRLKSNINVISYDSMPKIPHSVSLLDLAPSIV